MFNRQSLHIAMLLWGFIFSLIAALCMFISKNFDKDKRKLLIAMQLASAVLLCSDAFAWGYRGSAGMIGYYVVRISNFFVFFVSDVILFLFHGYVCCNLFGDEIRTRKTDFRIRAVYLIAVAGMILVVISQFTDLYYYFDAQNLYHRNHAYMLSLILPLAGMIFDLWLLIQYRKRISRHTFVSMLSYIILPLLAGVVLLFYYGISLMNLAISISMIIMFVAAMVEQNQKLAQREKEAADLKISILISQIAPHFIYNTLTSVEQMCDTNPIMAKETLGEFAEYLRGNINSLEEKDAIPFEKELAHVKCYLSIEKKRFGNRVRIQYDIKEEDFMIPALTLQPLVENAVKHGLCKKRGGGIIGIRTERRQDRIYIHVTDDGVGFDVAQAANDEHKCIGLKNVKKRVKDMCQGDLRVNSVIGKGTEVVIILPQK